MHLTEKEQMEKILLISGVKAQNCIQCGKCSATCPASAKMDILPHQFVNYVVNAKIAQLSKAETLWQCVSCFCYFCGHEVNAHSVKYCFCAGHAD